MKLRLLSHKIECVYKTTFANLVTFYECNVMVATSDTEKVKLGENFVIYIIYHIAGFFEGDIFTNFTND